MGGVEVRESADGMSGVDRHRAGRDRVATPAGMLTGRKVLRVKMTRRLDSIPA